MTGMHDTIGGNQANGYFNLSELTSRSPQIWSSDFGFSSHPNDSFRRRDDLFAKASLYGKAGKIITLSYHQCNPIIDEPCNFDKGVANLPLTAKEWDELLTDGSVLNLKWKKQMDIIANYISRLEQEGVQVYFRPYHESNLPSFWWGATSPSNTIKLWKQLHSYFTKKYLIRKTKWVWSVSYHAKYLHNFKTTYPGDEFVDILGIDIYPEHKNKDPSFKKAWDLLKEVSPKKPLALTEISRLPSSSELSEREWFYAVPWGETMLRRDNSEEEIKKFYQSPLVCN